LHSRASDATELRANYQRQLLHLLEASQLTMSRQTFIFVGAPAADHDLPRMIEHILGASFRHKEGSDPYVRVGSTAVYLGAHELDDDDIAWPGGIPLHSDYPAMLEIRDTAGDQQRQQAVGGQLFRALESVRRWPAVCIDDMQPGGRRAIAIRGVGDVIGERAAFQMQGLTRPHGNCTRSFQPTCCLAGRLSRQAQADCS
jgi:hypothetical protein